MFSKMFSKFSLIAFIFITVCAFAISANALELTEGVKTGMSVQEVEKSIDLKPHVNRGDLQFYERTDKGNAFYAFNTATDELVYKVVFYSEDSWDKLMDKFIDNLGEPVKRRDDKGFMKHFWTTGSEAGIIMSNNPDFEGVFQLWYGSVPLWNELTEQVSGLRKFPE